MSIDYINSFCKEYYDKPFTKDALFLTVPLLFIFNLFPFVMYNQNKIYIAPIWAIIWVLVFPLRFLALSFGRNVEFLESDQLTMPSFEHVDYLFNLNLGTMIHKKFKEVGKLEVNFSKPDFIKIKPRDLPSKQEWKCNESECTLIINYNNERSNLTMAFKIWTEEEFFNDYSNGQLDISYKLDGKNKSLHTKPILIKITK